ncbi:hypothetical protein ACHAWC_011444 [Mediolabrus comicus]
MSDEEERMRILKARIAELEAARAREAAAAAAADDEEEDGEEEEHEEDGEEEAAAAAADEEDGLEVNIVHNEATTTEDEEEVKQATDDTNADAAVEELSEELADTQIEDKEIADDVDTGSEKEDDVEEQKVLEEAPLPVAGCDDDNVEKVVAEVQAEPEEEDPAVSKVVEELENVKEEEEDDDDVNISQHISEQKLQSLKSKREQEFEELRKLAAARKIEEGGELSAFERMKLKKQQELDALRARGGVNAKNKSRFDTGQALTTDMSAWSRNQRLVAEEARKKRMEASESLKKTSAQSMSSWERNQLLDKDEARRRQMEAREGLHQYRTSLDPTASSDASTIHAIATHDAEKDLQTIEKRRFSFKDDLDDDIPPSQPEQQQIEQPTEEEPEPESAVRPSLLRAQQEPAKAHSYGLKPPAYSRVDIKFSFGLVVKSGTTDESLRDSETLRKCMNGTREILSDELPPPPDYNNMGAKSSVVSFKVKFPQAYYDPILEPTVISIEEDTSKKPAKGKNNTRTLCKASFPVFIRDEATDDEGKKRAALTLKETKATIFKALRAAVSGGKFLK